MANNDGFKRLTPGKSYIWNSRIFNDDPRKKYNTNDVQGGLQNTKADTAGAKHTGPYINCVLEVTKYYEERTKYVKVKITAADGRKLSVRCCKVKLHTKRKITIVRGSKFK